MSVDPPGMRTPELLVWLSTHLPEFDASGPPEYRLLAGGRSNVTYAVTDTSGRRWALRRPPLGHVMPSAHDMSREFRVLQGLGRVGFPAPPARVLCEDDAVIGAPFMVMDFVDGRVIGSSEDARDLSADEASGVSRTLVEGLASLHQVDVAAAGLADFGRPQGYLQRQVTRWGQQWPITKTRELASIDTLYAWLTEQVRDLPEDSPWSLVHGDYRLDNVILTPDLSRLLAVLDWEMSTLGDPVADLAIALVYWTEAGDGLRSGIPVAQGVTSGPGFWTRQQIADGYAVASGSDLRNLELCVVLACFKLAVIMESIHYRNLGGQQIGATAERGEDMGAATEAFAELGLQVISTGGIDGLAD